MEPKTVQHFEPWNRDALTLGDFGPVVVVRKKSRTMVVKMDTDFEVQTDHGTISGKAGDYLATNHPGRRLDVRHLAAQRGAVRRDVRAGRVGLSPGVTSPTPECVRVNCLPSWRTPSRANVVTLIGR